MTMIQPNQSLNAEAELLKAKMIDFIHERLGIVINSYQVNDIMKLINTACIKFKLSPDQYWQELLKATDQSPILNHLISSITICETYFYRDKQQMTLLNKDILPHIIKTKREQNNLSLRIWSAGCSSGEEIYTIAMFLIELIPDINNWTIKLLATDINIAALQKGISGIYTQWSMRSIPENYKKDYFTQTNNQYLIEKTLSNLVTFNYLNLNNESYPSIFTGTNSQDLILCRNVLIYFSPKSVSRVMQGLNKSLALDGYLLLGASDPLDIRNTDFIFNSKKGLLFSRPHQTPSEKTNQHLPSQLTSIKKSTEIVQPSTSQSQRLQSTTTLSEQAMELANKGNLREALKLCEAGFRAEPTNKFIYFIYALTLLELNKYEEAEAYFRKALFLDNKFVIAHFQLGLLLIQKKQNESGIKYLKNALSIAEHNNPNDKVIGSHGLNYQKLIDILKNEILIHTTNEANYGN